MELRSGRCLCSAKQIGLVSTMELRSGRRLCSTSTNEVRSPEAPDHGQDHISALPDDLLLLILVRFRRVRTAARTSILSSRWRNLWTLLPELIFSDVNYSSLEPTLARLVSPAVSLLDIDVAHMWTRLPPWDVNLDAAGVTSLLRAAAWLEPQHLVFAINNNVIQGQVVDVPCFRRTASIVLRSIISTPFRVLPGVEFAALDTLSLSCHIIGLDDLISRCPRLRVLRFTLCSKDNSAAVHSPSLQELFVDSIGGAYHVDIVAPVLTQLSVALRCPYKQVNISILAPMVETISWHCSYYYSDMVASIGFGRWRLEELSLERAERQGQLASLRIRASICSYLFADQVATLTQEIEKHMITTFSTLELHLITSWHVFGEFVFRLIGINRICSSMRRLKVIIWRSKVKEECPTNCPCCPTENVQTIPLIALEQLQIHGFEGVDHEYDFLKLMFKSAPMLRRVIVKLSREFSTSSKV